jgi:UDP-GlcNAc:undecaprenyl-phosphate GlcNAc-1-phosphate transferase
VNHPTHPSLEYLLVAAVAGAGSFLATPVARAIAVRWGAIARPRDRDVHAVAIPRMGGVALLVGFGLALFTASKLPTLRDAFDTGPEMPWIVVAAGLICLIGAIDDRFELDSLTKLAGQVLATGIMVTLGGVQLAEVYLPWGDNGTVVLGQDLAIPVTILLTVLTINAINFIDGLDGLAAGVTAIGALSFFAFSYHLGENNFQQIAAPPTLLTAALAGTCIGFLPHNFFPARIFMGDSGSMLVGLMLSAAATTATTNADPQGFNGGLRALPLFLPLLIPIAVLAIPFIDLLLAIVRRVTSGHSPFAPDKRHLHHRLLELGHSHRRAVLLLYFWSALVGFGGAALSIFSGTGTFVVVLVLGVVLGVLLLVVPRLQARRHAARERRRARADGVPRSGRSVRGRHARTDVIRPSAAGRGPAASTSKTGVASAGATEPAAGSAAGRRAI